MRSLLFTAFGVLLLLGVTPAHARDTEYNLPIADVLADAEFQRQIGNRVAFYFADQPTPAVAQSFGSYVANKKTNSAGRPDETACRWAMLSALVQFRDRADQLGADAVVGIVSYYNKETVGSRTEYECHAGNIVAGVALKGNFVKLGAGSAPAAAASKQGGSIARQPQPATTTDAAGRLKQLQSLKDQGLITDREYDQRRKAILDGL